LYGFIIKKMRASKKTNSQKPNENSKGEW